MTAKIGQNLFDVSAAVYGHPLGVYWLMEDNGFDSVLKEFSEETELLIRDDSIQLEETGNVIFKKAKLPDYIIRRRQSFWDIVIENQGSILGAFSVLEANQNMTGFTEHLFVDDPLIILENAQEPRVRKALKKDMPIATIDESMKADGIGFMHIERNFLIR